MNHISSLIEQYTPKKQTQTKITNERQLLIQEFEQELNKQRTGKYKKLRCGFIAMKMSHLDLWDLKVFLSQCRSASSFSKTWWWALKPQKVGIK